MGIMKWRARDVMMAAAFALSPLSAGCDDSLPDDDEFEGDGGVETPVCEASPLDCEELVCTGDYSTSSSTYPYPPPDCTTIEGNLTVVFWTESGFFPPECLRHVTGDLIIEADPWSDDLSGFKSLETIGQDLQIGFYWTSGGSDSIRNLDGLSNLRDVGGNINVFGNRNLQDVDGLCNLDHAAGISFSDNPALTNVDGLERIGFVENNLTFSSVSDGVGLPALQNVNGLRSLTSVGGNLHFGQWPEIYFTSLEDLSGLRNLTEIGGTFYLIGLSALQDLDGLTALQSIEAGLEIKDNNQLQDISGLSALEELGSFLWITSNDDLPTCQATDLLQGLGLGGEVGVCIFGNLDDSCDDVDNGGCGGTIYD